MNKHYLPVFQNILSVLLLTFGCFFANPAARACGYNWITDCSSQVQLRINGTLDSFQIAPCPYGYKFDGLYLGNLQSISLANARAITWESCQNNVSGVQLWYRVYEQGMNGGSWNTLDMQQDYFKIEGAYTTRYRSLPAETPFNNLVIGTTYTLEVYLVAQIDTIGDDFIPETTLLRNNNGQNYKLGFTYGGATAPPLLLLPHLTQPLCNGTSDGRISIAVYGDHNGIFYHWSNSNINFYELNQVPAGPYSLTVTNAAGAAVSTAVQLTQPPPVQISFSDIQSTGCNNSPGAATAQATGGAPPYQYLWSNGQTTATAGFNISGTWTVTVTDSHQCSLAASVSIQNNGLVERNISANICMGSSYNIGNQSFTTPGNYNINLPGIGGCDTIVHLSLNVQNPAALLQNLPPGAVLTCYTPTVDLCANSSPDAVYQWSQDGLPLGITPCIPATEPGIYSIQCTLGNCSASKTVPVEAHLSPLPDTIIGQFTITCLAPAPFWLTCNTQSQSPVFSWSFNGQVLSSSDSCLFDYHGFENGMPVLPELIVTDQFGCQNTHPVAAISQSTDVDIPSFTLNVTDAGNQQANNGSISIANLNPANCQISWNTGDTAQVLNQLGPGIYCVTVTGENGCISTNCAEVQLHLGLQETGLQALEMRPNPVSTGSMLAVSAPGKFIQGASKWSIRSLANQVMAFGEDTLSGNGPFFVPVPASLPAGIYLFQLENAAGFFNAEIMVTSR